MTEVVETKDIRKEKIVVIGILGQPRRNQGHPPASRFICSTFPRWSAEAENAVKLRPTAFRRLPKSAYVVDRE